MENWKKLFIGKYSRRVFSFHACVWVERQNWTWRPVNQRITQKAKPHWVKFAEGRNGINSNVIELTVITIKKSNNFKYYSLCMANMHVFLFVWLHCWYHSHPDRAPCRMLHPNSISLMPGMSLYPHAQYLKTEMDEFN